MNKLSHCLYPLFILCLIACSKAEKSDSEDSKPSLGSEARHAMESVAKTLAKKPESIKFDNVKTVFEDDSLCIIHADFSGKNDFDVVTTDPIEYIYLLHGDKKYEVLVEIDEDSVYLNKDAWAEYSKGTILQNLGYEKGIRQRAVKFLNKKGRVVGDKEQKQEVNIPLPSGTGQWELKYFSDEFGDQTTEGYLVLEGEGTFSNVATSNSDLTAYFYTPVDSTFCFKLVEYGWSVVKDVDIFDQTFYTTRIKDSAGQVHEFKLLSSSSTGQMYPAGNLADANLEMLDILKLGGVISVYITYDSSYSKSTYNFKMNVSGYENAYKLLSGGKAP